jgi:hypothetical protein
MISANDIKEAKFVYSNFTKRTNEKLDSFQEVYNIAKSLFQLGDHDIRIYTFITPEVKLTIHDDISLQKAFEANPNQSCLKFYIEIAQQEKTTSSPEDEKKIERPIFGEGSKEFVEEIMEKIINKKKQLSKEFFLNELSGNIVEQYTRKTDIELVKQYSKKLDHINIEINKGHRGVNSNLSLHSTESRWFTFIKTISNNITKVIPSNCDKDGSMVAQRFVSAYSQPAVAYTRKIDLEYVSLLGQNPIQIIAHKVYELYGTTKSSLLDSNTVVIGSPHSVTLYIAETLHAPLLPAGFIAFAKDWDEAAKITKYGTIGLVLVGGDYDFTGLWLWIKICDEDKIPKAYEEYLKNAKECVIVRATDGHSGTEIVGLYKNMYITAATPKGFLDQAYKDGMIPIKSKDVEHLRQWEWGLPDATITAFCNYWVNKLGRSADNFHIIESDVLGLYKAIPRIWENYLNYNKKPIRGFTLNGYWIAHPSYERAAGLIPFHFYRFEADDFKIISDYIKNRIINIKDRHLLDFTKISPSTFPVFVNNIGGEDDVERVRAMIEKLGLSDQCWFSNGLDCFGCVCRDVFGCEIPLPTDIISNWMKEEKNIPYFGTEFNPLPIKAVKEEFSNNKL